MNCLAHHTYVSLTSIVVIDFGRKNCFHIKALSNCEVGMGSWENVASGGWKRNRVRRCEGGVSLLCDLPPYPGVAGALFSFCSFLL